MGEIERLKTENWHLEQDMQYANDRIRGLEEDLRRMNARMKVLEAKAVAARELLDI